MNIYSFSILCFSFGVLMISVLALAKRRDQIAIRFLFFSISICWWGFIFCFWINQVFSPQKTLFLIRISYLGVLFIPITWFHFIMEFVKGKEPFRGFLALNYGIGGLLLLSLPTPYFFSGLHGYLGLKMVQTPAILHHIHMIQFLTLVPIGLAYLYGAYRHSSGPKHEQLRYLLLATVIGFTAGATIYFAFYQIPVPIYTSQADKLCFFECLKFECQQ